MFKKKPPTAWTDLNKRMTIEADKELEAKMSTKTTTTRSQATKGKWSVQKQLDRLSLHLHLPPLYSSQHENTTFHFIEK